MGAVPDDLNTNSAPFSVHTNRNTPERGADEMDATSSREFFTGLQNIEREIIANLRALGVPVTATDFKWNRGGAVLGPASEEATLEINVHGTLAKEAKAVFSRDQIQDSYARVDRRDVTAIIDAMVEQLSR